MNNQLQKEIKNFDKSNLINRLDYPEKIRKWVYKNTQYGSISSLATYITHSGGLHFQETKDGWISKELPGVCSGCKRETFKYICCKAFKQPYCFECWFECNNKFI